MNYDYLGTLFEFTVMGCKLAVPATRKNGWFETSYAKYRQRDDGYFDLFTGKDYWLVPEDVKLADSEAELVSALMDCRENEIPLRAIRSCYREGVPKFDDRVYLFRGEHDKQFGAIRINYNNAVLYRYDETQKYGSESSFTLPRLVITARDEYDLPRVLFALTACGGIKIKLNSRFLRFHDGAWEIAHDKYGEEWRPYDPH